MLKTKTSIEELVQETKHFLSRYIRVDRVILFGSYLYGHFREDSDIDLAVISDDFEKMSVLEQFQLLAKVPVFIDSRIEVIGFSKKDFSSPNRRSLLYLIKEQGKVYH